jgi:thiamine pyrophosphate-dependent acetolactate synthase large subunit-like protein
VQEVDIVSIVSPLTKYAITVLEPSDIRYHLEKAIYLARTGRPGPVWIDIPLDVQASPIDDPATLRGFNPADVAMTEDSRMTPANLKVQISKIRRSSTGPSGPCCSSETAFGSRARKRK